YLSTFSTFGYLLVFWSRHSPYSPYQIDDISIARELEYLNVREDVISEMETELQTQLSDTTGNTLFALLDSTPLPFVGALSVQLYGDAERSQINRIDDLIVMLYWLIYSRRYGGKVE